MSIASSDDVRGAHSRLLLAAERFTVGPHETPTALRDARTSFVVAVESYGLAQREASRLHYYRLAGILEADPDLVAPLAEKVLLRADLDLPGLDELEEVPAA